MHHLNALTTNREKDIIYLYKVYELVMKVPFNLITIKIHISTTSIILYKVHELVINVPFNLITIKIHIYI
jgi:hypothetical protein